MFKSIRNNIRLFFLTVLPVLTASLLIGIGTMSLAQHVMPVLEAQSSLDLQAYSHEALTVTNGAAVSLTSTLRAPSNQPSARAIYLTVETAEIRMRYDGTAPTTTTGHAVPSAATMTLYGVSNLSNLRLIASSATATVRVTYLR